MPRYRMREDYYDPSYARLTQQERLAIKARMVQEQKREVAIAEAQAEAEQVALRRAEKLEVMEEQRQRTRYYEEAGATPEFKESVKFYTSIGYPHYAGEYAPFTVPIGYKVSGIKEVVPVTPTGVKRPAYLTVTFKPPEEQKGIAETILSWDIPSYKGPSLMDIISPGTKVLPRTATVSEFGRISGITVHPLTPIAAPIASFESPIYSLGRLVGVPTPRPPPTFIGGVIGKGLEAGLGWESTELERTMAYGPQYAVGTIFGDIFVSYLLGKGVEKVVVKPIQTRASTWLSKQYLEKGPLAWKGFPEKAVMRITGAKPYFPSGVVSYPAVGKVGLKGLKAQQLAWELSLTPRTSLVTVTKVGAKRSVFTFTRGVGYTPMAVTLAKAMSVKEMGGRQALLRIQKPVRGKLPYLPSLIFKEPLTRLPQLLGIGLTLGLRGLPGLVSIEEPKRKEKLKPLLFPKLVPRVTPITRLKPFVSPIARAKERLVPALIPIQTQIVKQITIQETMLQQLTIQETTIKQLPIQILPVPMPTPVIPTLPTPRIPPFRLPHRRVVSRGRRGLFGKWFKRIHPIKSPEEMARIFFGERKPRRKKGKRVKKKRGKTKKRKGN